VILDPVTLRYAQALWNVALKSGALERVRADVRALDGALKAQVFDPAILRDKRRALALSAVSGLHPLLQNFTGLLFDKHREDVLRGLSRAFHRMELESRNAVEGIVESARPIGEDLLASIAARMGQLLGKEVVLKNRIVPELVGGTRVLVANRMLDASVAGRLESLRRTLLDAPLQSARS
jgi:F-type H+-transporting ATPase subunit delta